MKKKQQTNKQKQKAFNVTGKKEHRKKGKRDFKIFAP